MTDNHGNINVGDKMLENDLLLLRTYDKIRYADTDQQGHVNNSVFSTFLETGRVEFLYNPEYDLLSESCSFVIASLNLNYVKELKWPGTVEIYTGITKIGNSSMKIFQRLFQDSDCCATAETTIVQVSNESGKSVPLSENARSYLLRWVVSSSE